MTPEIIYYSSFGVALLASILIFNYIRRVALKTGNKKGQKQNKRLFEKTYKSLKVREELRVAEYNKLIEESGYQDKIGFMCKVDEILNYSGVRSWASDTPSELFLIVFIMTGLLVGGVTYSLTQSFIFFAFAFAIVVIAFYLALQIVANKNYMKIEKQLKTFIKYADSYSKASDDIVNIIYQTSQHMEAPLDQIFKDFYRDAIHINKKKAFERMEQKINHDKLKELLHNLYQCSISNADYAQVFYEVRDNIDLYLNGKKKRKAIRNSSRKDIIIVVIGCFICLWAFGSMLESGNIIAELNKTLIGRILIAFLGGSLLVAFYEIVRVDKK